MLQKKVVILKQPHTGRPCGSVALYLSGNTLNAVLNLPNISTDRAYIALEGENIPVFAFKAGQSAAVDVAEIQFSGGFAAAVVRADSAGPELLAFGHYGRCDITAPSLMCRLKRRFAGGVFIRDKASSSAQQEKPKAAAEYIAEEKSKADSQDIAEEKPVNVNRDILENEPIPADIDTEPRQVKQKSIANGDKKNDNTVGREIEREETQVLHIDEQEDNSPPCGLQSWQDYEKALRQDPFLAEDTTLNDPDLVVQENYFLFQKDGHSDTDTVIARQQQSEVEDVTSQYFHIPPPKKPCHSIDKVGDLNAGGQQPPNIGSFDKNAHTGYMPYAMDINKKYVRGETNMRYYNSVKDNILPLLQDNPKDDELMAILPDSDFVRVNYAEGRYYSVGIIRENGQPVYICYGVPSQYLERPPEQFEGKGRWIPLSPLQPKDRGYYMLFQSVDDGSVIDTENISK